MNFKKEDETMKQFEMYELTIKGEEPQCSQALVDVTAEFTCDGQTTKVKGFYAGDGNYKVRFYPSLAGTYTYRVSGLMQAEGSLECLPNEDKKAGIVRAEGTHFVYDGGEIFKPFGTTIYALSHQEEERIAQTMETLSTAPFNKVRHCVFPKHYDYNHNDPELYAFEKDADGKWDVNRPCFAFWEHLEKQIFALADMGIQSDLILFHPYDKWGFSRMSMEENFIYLDYLIRRLAAIPQIWWSMTNEYDLIMSRTMEDWYAIEEFIAKEDPYHHLLSNHNCFDFYDFKRKNVTHQCVQTVLVQKAADWIKEIGKPLCYDECCYEGNLPLTWGNISGWEMANRFWMAVCQGAYATHGEVFLSDDEVLWWAKGGVLKGESPKRIAYLKEIVDAIPGAIEPWEEYHNFDIEEFMKRHTPEEIQMLQNSPIVQHAKNPTEVEDIVSKFKDYNAFGHVGEDYYIGYYGHHCNGIATWKLPEDHQYKIEIIDMWNMTRDVTMTGVSGRFDVKMPGKEGIAVLASRID